MRHARQILQRIALVIAVALVAVICLSSGTLAAIVGIVTAIVVALDMLVAYTRERERERIEARRSAQSDKLNVDLTRRQ